MLNLSFKSTYTGEKVTGVVTSVAPNEVAVDIGTKHAGYIPLSELTDDPGCQGRPTWYKKGDKLDLIVLRVNDVEGTVMLSKKRLDAIAGFEKIAERLRERRGSGRRCNRMVIKRRRAGSHQWREGVHSCFPGYPFPQR